MFRCAICDDRRYKHATRGIRQRNVAQLIDHMVSTHPTLLWRATGPQFNTWARKQQVYKCICGKVGFKVQMMHHLLGQKDLWDHFAAGRLLDSHNP